MPKSVRLFMIALGITLIVISIMALWYGLAPVAVHQAQETLAPTLLVAPTP